MANALFEREPLKAVSYGHFEAQPVTGTFGATISGVQVADAVKDDSLFEELHAAWVEYQVLFFHEQKLEPGQQLALGERFGEIQKLGYVGSLEGFEGVWVQEYPAMYSGPVSDINWHSDSSFRAKPTRGSLLYALDVPAGGGDTVWADQCAAYADLSPAWRAFLDGLRVVHDNLASNPYRVFDQIGGKALTDMRKFLPPTEHPLVCTHPESGRQFLFVSELMAREVVGMNGRESRAVLDFLFAHQTRPEYQARLHWRAGSLALWDNYSTLHRGIFDFGQAHRLMHRVSFNTGWIQGFEAGSPPAEPAR
jgi:alpha-ketoglutarate-dependent taurine dioxygenase